MQSGDRGDKGKTEPVALDLCTAFQSVEPLENLVPHLVRYAQSVIGHARDYP